MKRYLNILLAVILTFSAIRIAAYAKNDDFNTENFNEYEWNVLKIVNKERIAGGKKPLTMDFTIQKVCDLRETELITHFSHYMPDGTNAYLPKIEEYGVNWSACGENIAAGYSSPAAVMNGWMNSEGHKKNILSTSFDHIGIGYCDEARTWVQVFVGDKCNYSDMHIITTDKSYPVDTPIEDVEAYIELDCKEHGKTYMPLIAEICTGYDSSAKGNQNVTVCAFNLTAELKVKIGNNNEEITDTKTTTPITTTLPQATTVPVITTVIETTTATEVTTIIETTTIPEITSDTEDLTDCEKIIIHKVLEIPLGLTKNSVKTEILNAFDVKEMRVYNQNNEEVTSAKTIGTGYFIECDLTSNTTYIYTVYVKGDLNGDGKITAADAREILRASAKLTQINDLQQLAGDVTNDKKLTASDARIVLRCAAGLQKL